VDGIEDVGEAGSPQLPAFGYGALTLMEPACRPGAFASARRGAGKSRLGRELPSSALWTAAGRRTLPPGGRPLVSTSASASFAFWLILSLGSARENQTPGFLSNCTCWAPESTFTTFARIQSPWVVDRYCTREPSIPGAVALVSPCNLVGTSDLIPPCERTLLGELKLCRSATNVLCTT